MILVGAGAYLVTVAALAGFGEVGAAVREVPSSMCHASTDNYGSGLDNGGAINNNTAGAVPINCPIVSDSGQSGQSITGVAVYGREAADGGYSVACSCTAAASSITCTCPSVTPWNNSTGMLVANITGSSSLSLWTQGPSTRFRWLLHNVTPGSSLIGFKTSSP